MKDKKAQQGQRDVYIPRIALYPKNITEFGFEWTRVQFPVSVAFAMTINASQAICLIFLPIIACWLQFWMQGQTLKMVGVWLVNGPSFTHGQLYVAVSRYQNGQVYHGLGIMQICRVGHPEDLIIAVKKESDQFLTKNVVYREVLLHRRCLPPTSHLQPASSPPQSAAVVVSAGQPDDLDYTGIYDGMEEEDEGADYVVEAVLERKVVTGKRGKSHKVGRHCWRYNSVMTY